MKIQNRYILTGIIFILIPVIQRVLEIVIILIQRQMKWIEKFSFSTAENLRMKTPHEKRR